MSSAYWNCAMCGRQTLKELLDEACLCPECSSLASTAPPVLESPKAPVSDAEIAQAFPLKEV